MSKPNYQQMSRQELRAYVLNHRSDDEALRIYMDRLRSEPGVSRFRVGTNEEDTGRLEAWLEEQLKRPY
jgi:hypothetical protein